MNGKVAKRLRKLAVQQSDMKKSEKEQIVYPHKMKRKIGEKIVEQAINFVTQKYKKDSPMFLYRKLKRQWKALSWDRRRIENLIVN